MINNARVTQPMGTAARASRVTDTAMPAGRATLGWTVRARAPVTTVCVTLGQMERGPVWSASQATSAATARHCAPACMECAMTVSQGALHVHMSGCMCVGGWLCVAVKEATVYVCMNVLRLLSAVAVCCPCRAGWQWNMCYL